MHWLKVLMRLARFVIWGDPYRRRTMPELTTVLRRVGYAVCGLVLLVALLMATTEPNDHTRFHATSRQSGTR